MPAEETPAQPIETPAPAPAAVVAPTKSAQDLLIEQYELPDSNVYVEVPDAPAPAPAAVVKPAHSQRALRMAADFGIPQEEIDTADPEQLDFAIYQLHRARMQDIDRQPARQTPQPTANQIKEPPPPEPEFDLGIEPELFDTLHDSLKGAFQKITAEIRELRGLKGEFGGLKQHVQAQQAEAMDARMDRSFARHKDHLGEGARQELDPTSAEYQRRLAVLALAQRDQGRGTLEQKIDRAVAVLYGVAPPAAPGTPTPAPVAPAAPAPALTRDAQGRITGRITPEAWNAAGTARPSHRSGAQLPPGKERAEKFAAEFFRTNELAEAANGKQEAEEDGIPE